MASKPSPVTASVVEWAVAEDGRDLQTLSEALAVDTDTLDAWVAGVAKPTQGQVSNLAKVLKRPRALFFLPRPPSATALPASFRHPPGDARLVSAEVRRRVRQARRVQQAMTWILRDDALVELPTASVATNPETAASIARTWLGVHEDTQAAWRDDYAALAAWRRALDERQIMVFSLDIGRGDVRGFSAWDEHAPLIVMNSTGVNPAARCFTLMHELGHLLLRQDAACIESEGPNASGVDVERWCESFAASVLMPEAATRAWATDRRLSTEGASIGDVRAMMTRFRVSARAAALRLIAMRYASAALYAEVIRVFAPKPPEEVSRPMSSPPRSELRQRQYGDRVLRTLINDLPQRDSLSILRVEVEDVRRIADKVPGVQDF